MVKGTLEHYKSKVVDELKSELKVKSNMAVPRLSKIVLNMGLGESKTNKNVLTDGIKILTQIAGQQAVATKSMKSVSAFKLREGMLVGARVTLRRQRMWDFLTRLIHMDLPRVKDFRGTSKKSFDGRGNYSMGIDDHTIFPELDGFQSGLVKGLTITMVTTAKKDDDALKCLKALGMPFQN